MITKALAAAIRGLQDGRRTQGYMTRRMGYDLNRIRALEEAIERYEKAMKQFEMREKLKQL